MKTSCKRRTNALMLSLSKHELALVPSLTNL